MTHRLFNVLACAVAIVLFTLPAAGDEAPGDAASMDDARAQYQLQLERVQRYTERIKPHAEAIQELLLQLQAGEIDLVAYREAIAPHQQAIERIERQMRSEFEADADADPDRQADDESDRNSDHFAPGEFRDLADSEKLSRPDFDEVRVGQAGEDPDQQVTRNDDGPDNGNGGDGDGAELLPDELMQRYREAMERYGHAMRVLIERLQQQQISSDRFREIMEEHGQRILESQRHIQPEMNRLVDEMRRRQIAIRAGEDPDETRPADFDAFARQLAEIVDEIESTTAQIEAELGIDPPRQDDEGEEDDEE